LASVLLVAIDVIQKHKDRRIKKNPASHRTIQQVLCLQEL
jgi:hypothetical protein